MSIGNKEMTVTFAVPINDEAVARHFLSINLLESLEWQYTADICGQNKCLEIRLLCQYDKLPLRHLPIVPPKS